MAIISLVNTYNGLKLFVIDEPRFKWGYQSLESIILMELLPTIACLVFVSVGLFSMMSFLIESSILQPKIIDSTNFDSYGTFVNLSV